MSKVMRAQEGCHGLFKGQVTTLQNIDAPEHVGGRQEHQVMGPSDAPWLLKGPK